MKVFRSCLLAILAGACFTAAPAGQAQAETRFHLNWMSPGYFPPPPPRRHYYYYPEAYEDPYEYDNYDDEYDEEVYYYPYYEDDEFEPAPRYQPRKKSKAATAYAAPDDVEPVPAPKLKKKPAAKATPTKPQASTNTAATSETSPKTASVSCDKARSIISGYGFGDVQTKSCSGQIYSFAAKRGGKSFSVKVSALSGELTEVKRQ